MTTREKMKKWREGKNLTFDILSRRSGVSEDLLKMVESCHVTHPIIAKKIAALYELTEEESYDLMPEIHRPNSPNYDPMKYVEPESENPGFVPFIKKKKADMLFESYIYDHRENLRRYLRKDKKKYIDS